MAAIEALDSVEVDFSGRQFVHLQSAPATVWDAERREQVPKIGADGVPIWNRILLAVAPDGSKQTLKYSVSAPELAAWPDFAPVKVGRMRVGSWATSTRSGVKGGLWFQVIDEPELLGQSSSRRSNGGEG